MTTAKDVSSLSQLESQLNHWTTLKTQYYKDYTCQLYGGANCPRKGAGPAYKLSHQNYVNASNEVTNYQTQISHVQSEIQQRDKFLSSTSAASQAQRYQEALTQRPIVQQEYNTAVQRRNDLQASYYAQEQAAHGILMRLEALSQLSSGNPTVSAARFLLFLLFLVIECLPVTVKLFQRPGQYEAAMQRARTAERRDFEKFFGTRSRFALGGLASAGGRPNVLQLRPEPEGQVDPAIWQRTRMLPMGQDLPEDERPTERFADPGYARGGSGDDGPPPSPEAARQPGRWRGPDAWRTEWGEPEPEAWVPEPRLESASHDRPGVPTRHDSWVAPTVADYQRTDEAARERSYRPEPGAKGTDFYPGEEDAGYGTPVAPEGDSMSGPYESDGTGIPLEWEDD